MISQDSDDQNLLTKIVPITVAMLSNTLLTLINVYHNNNSPNTFFGMNLATIFSNLIGYLLIISLNIGLGSEISQILTHIPKTGKQYAFRKIAISYQRALVVNFMCCVFIITPVLYLSKYILIGYQDLDRKIQILQTTSTYLFQLAPSIYCFTFFDTTRVYLEAQGIRIAPMLILMCATVMHYFLSEFLINNLTQKGMGAAWSKNITDCCCAIMLYIYINKSTVVNKTWNIQWSIDCVFNWNFHFKTFIKMGMTTYIEAIMFTIFSLIGSKLPLQKLIIHICFINWSQVFFVIFLGVKQGIINHINQDKHTLRQKFISGMKICCVLALVLNFLMIVYKDGADSFFIVSSTSSVPFATYLVFILSNLIDSVQICVAGLLKSIDKSHYILVTMVLCYSNGLIFCYYLGYKLDWGIKGLWIGWIAGLIINLILCMIKIKKEVLYQQRMSLKKKSDDLSV